jgi:hypothetical protein
MISAGEIVPTVDVKDSPDKYYPAGANEPTEEVKDNPVRNFLD